MTLEPGTEFGGYRIEVLLGAGGFCNVYLAEDLRPALRRKVALKVLNPTLSADPKNRERFQRESLLAVELDDHPNIVGVLDAGEVEGQLFIAQRYIEGRDLAKVLEEDGPLAPERAAEVVEQIGSALDYAHEAGLVHRDVKPRNILIRERDQRCFLADFGLTKRTAASDSLTGAGEFLGTFAYAAPEQLGGKPVDGRADLYALGCVLYEALTGTAPFSGDIHTMITSHLTKAPPQVTAARPGLPPGVDAVIARAMAKEPGERYQTGAELAAGLRAALAATPAPPPPPATPAPPPPPAAAPPPPAAAPPPPAQPPPVAPTPPVGVAPAAPGGGGGRSKLPLLLGGGALLVVVVVLLAVVLGGGGGDSGDDADEEDRQAEEEREEEQEREEAQEAAEEAFERLPGSLPAACDLGDVDDNDNGVVASITCAPTQGAEAVEVTVFEDEEDVEEGFVSAQEAAAEPLDSDGDCSTAVYATHPWTTEDDPEGVAGQVACWRDGQGGSGLAWTDTGRQLLAVATRSDESDGLLYRWWEALVDRGDPRDAEPFPDAVEQELLTHVPTAFRDSCIRADLRPQETASVQCSPRGAASVVFYNQYPDGAGAEAQYDRMIEAAGVSPDSGAQNDCPFESELTVGEEVRGRVACYLQEDGDAYLVWFNRPTGIQAEAAIADDATLRQFWRWWTRAGPLS